MNLYLYCVLDADFNPPEIPGVQNQPSRTVEINGLWIVVSPFSGTEIPTSKEHIARHERLIEGYLHRTTPLPFRFGSIVGEDRLREFITKHTDILRKDLSRVRNCVEMGLKVMVPAPDTTKARTGTEFLEAKRRVQDLKREVAGWVKGRVAATVRETEITLMQGTGMPIVRIAHLVPRDRLFDYKSHIDRALQERTEYHFLRSGPWPPYSFVSTAEMTP